MSREIVLNPQYEFLREFVEQLPERFAAEGECIHRGRNVLKIYTEQGHSLNVKRFKRPDFPNKFIYGWLRKPKCRRAYEYALELATMGFRTPDPVAWVVVRKWGIIRDSYLVTLQSDWLHFTEVASVYPAPESIPVVNAFVRYALSLHDAGVEHRDFNHSNILYRRNPESGDCEFELVDINRMRLHYRPLSKRECIVNLRRLFCPALPFLHILKYYADLRGWDHDEMLLKGIFLRLGFVRFKEHKHQVVEWLRGLFSHEGKK